MIVAPAGFAPIPTFRCVPRALAAKRSVHQTASVSPALATATAARSVTVDEILTLVNMALGNGGSCPNGVPAGIDVNVALIVQAVTNALNGCVA